MSLFTRLGKSISGYLSVLTSVALIGLCLWGVVWSFYRHGLGHGVASLFLPPYAFYRGLASTWEPPRWREHYDIASEHLAQVVIAMPGSDVGQQAAVTDLTASLKKYISALPAGKAVDLKLCAESLCDALFLHVAVMGFQSTGRPVRGTILSELEDAEAGFMKNPNFAKVWTRYREHNDKGFIDELLAKGSAAERLRTDAALAASAEQEFSRLTEQFKREAEIRIAEIFGTPPRSVKQAVKPTVPRNPGSI